MLGKFGVIHFSLSLSLSIYIYIYRKPKTTWRSKRQVSFLRRAGRVVFGEPCGGGPSESLVLLRGAAPPTEAPVTAPAKACRARGKNCGPPEASPRGSRGLRPPNLPSKGFFAELHGTVRESVFSGCHSGGFATKSQPPKTAPRCSPDLSEQMWA